MILSKTSEYALRILSYMARHEQEKLSAQEMHEKMHIPCRYMCRLLTRLAASGFIKSERGISGGFIFAKPLDQIYVGEVIASVEGFEKESYCILGFEECSFEKACSMHAIWADAREKVVQVLTTTTVADLMTKEIKVF